MTPLRFPPLRRWSVAASGAALAVLIAWPVQAERADRGKPLNVAPTAGHGRLIKQVVSQRNVSSQRAESLKATASRARIPTLRVAVASHTGRPANFAKWRGRGRIHRRPGRPRGTGKRRHRFVHNASCAARGASIGDDHRKPHKPKTTPAKFSVSAARRRRPPAVWRPRASRATPREGTQPRPRRRRKRACRSRRAPSSGQE